MDGPESEAGVKVKCCEVWYTDVSFAQIYRVGPFVIVMSFRCWDWSGLELVQK